ncbi:MAG: HNH endonuclease signature motif containing protein [candidate division WOR-3 bacterium]
MFVFVFVFVFVFMTKSKHFTISSTKKKHNEHHRYYSLVKILGVLIILTVMLTFSSSYFSFLRQCYEFVKTIPKLLFIIITLFSLFGVSITVNSPSSSSLSLSSSPRSSLFTSFPFFSHLITESFTNQANIHSLDKSGANKRLVSESLKKWVAAHQKWVCGMCGQLLDETYEIDHIVPLYAGGSNQKDNLMALDPICHRKKTNMDRIKYFHC